VIVAEKSIVDSNDGTKRRRQSKWWMETGIRHPTAFHTYTKLDKALEIGGSLEE